MELKGSKTEKNLMEAFAGGPQQVHVLCLGGQKGRL